jgi:crotonobetainyl-CoA:carnitine CoA-transferase CaiB-like acyl-CoA transferase
MVYGILAALYHREKTGRGQKIEVDLFRALIAHQTQEFVTTLNTGRVFERPASGIAHPGMPAPFGVYRTQDGFLNIAMNPLAKVAQALEAPELLRFDDPQALFDQRDEVHAAIEAVTQTRPTAAWIERLLALDLWCSEVLRQEEVPDDPQVKHMNAFTSYQHPVIGEVKTVNVPITFSETPGKVERHAPMVGEHTVEVLAELGIDADRIAALKEAGAIWVNPRTQAA